MHTARGLTPLFSTKRAPGAPEPTAPRSFGGTTHILHRIFGAGIQIGDSHNGGGVRVRFGSRRRLSHVLNRVVRFNRRSRSRRWIPRDSYFNGRHHH